MDSQQTESSATLPKERAFFDDVFALPAPGVSLYFRGGSKNDTELKITRCGKYVIGRERNADIRFTDADKVDGKVSRRHAVLVVDAEKVAIINCTPRNGLKVDSVRLQDFQELVLNDADVIALGDGGPIVRIRIGSLDTVTE